MRKKLAKSLCNINRLAVKGLLAGKDLSARDLAQSLGISGPYLHDLLYGRRNVSAYLPQIAKFLGVSVKRITVSRPSSSSSGQRGPSALAASPQE